MECRPAMQLDDSSLRCHRRSGCGASMATLRPGKVCATSPPKMVITRRRSWLLACVKQFACNSMENARFSVDIDVDEVALHEVEGFVISDWIFGLRDAATSIGAGLDIEMPYRMVRAQHLATALERGEASWDDVDAAVERVVSFPHSTETQHRSATTDGMDGGIWLATRRPRPIHSDSACRLRRLPSNMSMSMSMSMASSAIRWSPSGVQ